MWRVAVGAVITLSACCNAIGQQIDLGTVSSAHSSRRQHVELISDTITVTAGKPQDVDVIFRVDPGFHINSHRPKDELLIPTNLKLDQQDAVKLAPETYPNGAPFKISVGDESELLDVYTGEFRVSLRLTAPRGTAKLRGTLHYQACDNAACFPPRDLPVVLTLSAK